MARRDNRQTIAASPTVTSVFRSHAVTGGTDGCGARRLLVSCAADSSFPIEYRVDGIDPADEWGYLAPGECAPIIGDSSPINHIQMRGVGGEATGGVEVLSV